ncbi:MAG: hypothetical protein ACOVOX_13865, partial [Burkholderiaceae bacterium]
MSTAARPTPPTDRSKAGALAAQAAAAAANSNAPAQIAKAALRRLLLDKLEPTPSNYERAYAQESGGASTAAALPEKAQRLVEKLAGRALDSRAGADLAKAMGEGRWDVAERLLSAPDESGAQLSDMIDRVVKGVGRGGRQWTTARKKESLQRVLSGSRSDAGKLQQRLNQLLTSWDTDTLDEAVDTDVSPLDETPAPPPPSAPEANLPLLKLTPSVDAQASATANLQPALAAQNPLEWSPVVGHLGGTVQQALPAAEEAAARPRAPRPGPP